MRLSQTLPPLLLLVSLLATGVPALAEAGSPLVVAPDGPYPSIAAALADASPGDVIEVHGGIHPAPLIVDKPVTLRGIGQPVIDGRGEGSLVIIEAAGVVFQGFTLRNTGSNQSHEDTAVVILADDVTVADNRLENVLFGIYFAEADGGIARDNVIRGQEIDVGLKGDAIRVYYSADVLLENNDVAGGRDILIWYANGITIRGNRFHHNRYGLHFMYTTLAHVIGNTYENNHVGAYLMYSADVTVAGNTIINNRGPSGYGLALKDMDNVEVRDNIIAGNRAGLYLDNSPSRFDVTNTFTRNLFAYNDIGVTALPAVARNTFRANTFFENNQQVSTQGRGTLQGNQWDSEGEGNYWSDYAGYDVARDGIGDTAYRSEKLFESLTDIFPVLRLFVYSPAAQAIDFAAAAFPALRPEPRLIDNAPLMQLLFPAMVSTGPTAPSLSMLAASLVLIGLGGGIVLGALGRRRAAQKSAPAPAVHVPL